MPKPSATILSVVGARPNFMKLAPLARELRARDDVRHVIVHTGQHYDTQMSATFFADLGIPAPDHDLEVGSGTHAQQTATIMQRIEPVLTSVRPDIVVVYGDVNSTVAAALTAAKLGIVVAHVEAGLRSRDWAMPEEVNRVVTDRLSHLLFTPSRDADQNLLAEGVPSDRIHFVGNIMIDSLVHALPRALALDAPARHGLQPSHYVLVTLHRPSNVDDPRTLSHLIEVLRDLSTDGPVLFPVHPRTRQRILSQNLAGGSTGDLRLIEPLGYLEMLGLVASAGVVVTDSGGLQEESSFLGVPCLTVRPNTERPITCAEGTNRLVSPEREVLLPAARNALRNASRAVVSIEGWDGATAGRIARVLRNGG